MGLRERIDEVEELGRDVRAGRNGELYKRFIALLMRHLRSCASGWGFRPVHGADMEDFCQEGIEEAFNNWNDNVKLLWRVQNFARRAYRRHLRAIRHQELVDEFEAFLSQLVDVKSGYGVRRLITKEYSQIVMTELRKEKPPCPQVVRMFIWEGMHYWEIAIDVGLSTSRCRGVFFDNKKSVKQRLLRKYPEDFRRFLRP